MIHIIATAETKMNAQLKIIARQKQLFIKQQLPHREENIITSGLAKHHLKKDTTTTKKASTMSSINMRQVFPTTYGALKKTKLITT